MTTPSTRTRGPSEANKSAEKYLKRYPNTSRRALAAKFGIHPTTISRAPWWKNRSAQKSNNQGE